MDKEELKKQLLGQANTNANESLGLTQEYNKDNRNKLWEGSYGTKAKNEYRNQSFGTNKDGSAKQTHTNPYSEENGVLHKSHQAAKNKYGKEWAKHAAEVDHVVALKDAHDKAKHNAFLTDDDFREIMNSEENFRMLSKSQNTKKGAKSDWELVFDKDSGLSMDARKQFAKERISAEVSLQGMFAQKTAKNMGSEFVRGSADAISQSLIPLTLDATNHMLKVVKGEESFGDAAKDISKELIDVAVLGGQHKLLMDKVTHSLLKSNNPLLKNVAVSGQIGNLVAVATIVQDAAVKFVNGELSGEEFVQEIGKKGTVMVAGMVGGTVGRNLGGAIGTFLLPGVGTVAGSVAGEVLATVLTTVCCSAVLTVFDVNKHLDDYKLTEAHIRKIEKEALYEMQKQREKFKEIVEREYQIWDEKIASGFDQMLSCACEETFHIQGVTDGLEQVLSVFGKTVRFKNLQEYEDQLDMPLKLSF